MNKTMTIKASVAAWCAPHSIVSLSDAMTSGDTVRIVESIAFYGNPEREAFCDWARVGVAEITVTLLPRDEQIRMATEVLQRELEQARAEWMTKQQEILDRISKLQAIGYEVEA